MRARPWKHELNVVPVLTCAVLTWCAVGAAWAQSYPAKPIRLIAPFAAAGGTDATARIRDETARYARLIKAANITVE